jgi:hypothetical protein
MKQWPTPRLLLRSRAVTTDDCASEASSTLAGLIGRGTSSMGGLRDSSSDGGDEWDVERRAALKADRAAAEAAWGAHVADNDIGVLRWKAVSLLLEFGALKGLTTGVKTHVYLSRCSCIHTSCIIPILKER